MSAAKKKPRAGLLGRLGSLVRFVQGRGRPLALTLVILVMFFGCWYAVWREVGDEVLSSDQYWLTRDGVEITPTPKWIRRDIVDDVFRYGSLEGKLSTLDPELSERVSVAFSLHPWIAEVRQVAKTSGAKVTVSLVYRRPVCMVQVVDELLPVDVEGVLLPREDFSPVEADSYPRVVGVDSLPRGSTGTHWGDVRVVGAAEIADAIGPTWQELGLERIEPDPLTESSHSGECLFWLITRGGTAIRWGYAPGTDAPGELPAADKITRLVNEFQENSGSLDNAGGSGVIDIRYLQATTETETPRR